jgi:hypothetical protein
MVPIEQKDGTEEDRASKPGQITHSIPRRGTFLKSLKTDEFKLLEEKENLPGADLLIIIGDDDIPEGPELEKRYLSTFKQAQGLEQELRELIAALTVGKESKKAILQTMLHYGRTRELSVGSMLSSS